MWDWLTRLFQKKRKTPYTTTFLPVPADQTLSRPHRQNELPRKKAAEDLKGKRLLVEHPTRPRPSYSPPS